MCHKCFFNESLVGRKWESFGRKDFLFFLFADVLRFFSFEPSLKILEIRRKIALMNLFDTEWSLSLQEAIEDAHV